ncbi:MAG: Ubiquinol-cytochrome C reductase iron-sulfur subunit [uncultured Acidimicrobiales bacterium]|uniref:Cytochrome bc1 complex Rieske iron-sulfur subunit n=1 Tax=uncultured Acidimicrobiales bacterium TaxID=310071 RepID=A0A6J4JC17_9ACTN|nr:MAG: Ubiquinol-cytochrome C reductase iron-sulfur subunit [uncultured Acidimicrobiales bacterium]
MPDNDKGMPAERRIGALLVISTVAALALAVVYIGGGQPQAEGALLGIALGAIGFALILWARGLSTEGTVTAERGPLGGDHEDEDVVEERIEEVSDEPGRRSVLKLFWAAGGALALAAVFPIRSLGPAPGRSLLTTAWKPGARLVDEEGRPVRVETLPVGGTLTAFPQDAEHAADSQVVVVRVADGEIRPRPGRESWSPEGYIAYSKICPHVGCPVGLYQSDTHELLCPCHQSTFDVLDGARPRFGPATRSLPQLPLAVDREGFLTAQADFDEPVGPAFWNRG